MDECHERGTEILKGKLDILHNMAKVLITKETIHTDEVNMLIAGESAETVINFIDKKYNPDAPSSVKENKAEKAEEITIEKAAEPKQIIAPKDDDSSPSDGENKQ